MPANPGDHALHLYPRGAVDYMRDTQFRGNLITPFTAGAIISYELFPNVLVSMYGRYEVAYEPELLEHHIAFFDGQQGWDRLLDHPPADAALVRVDAPVADSLAGLTTWGLVYRDDAFELYTRGSHGASVVDRRGERLRTTFP
jgi:hypothetical protein